MSCFLCLCIYMFGLTIKKYHISISGRNISYVFYQTLNVLCQFFIIINGKYSDILCSCDEIISFGVGHYNIKWSLCYF